MLISFAGYLIHLSCFCPNLLRFINPVFFLERWQNPSSSSRIPSTARGLIGDFDRAKPFRDCIRISRDGCQQSLCDGVTCWSPLLEASLSLPFLLDVIHVKCGLGILTGLQSFVSNAEGSLTGPGTEAHLANCGHDLALRSDHGVLLKGSPHYLEAVLYGHVQVRQVVVEADVTDDSSKLSFHPPSPQLPSCLLPGFRVERCRISVATFVDSAWIVDLDFHYITRRLSPMRAEGWPVSLSKPIDFTFESRIVHTALHIVTCTGCANGGLGPLHHGPVYGTVLHVRLVPSSSIR